MVLILCTSIIKNRLFKYLPGVSMTFIIWPLFRVHDRNSELLVMPNELFWDLNSFFPRILLPVALFPFPVRPINTKVREGTSVIVIYLNLNYRLYKLINHNIKEEEKLQKPNCLCMLQQKNTNIFPFYRTVKLIVTVTSFTKIGV